MLPDPVPPVQRLPLHGDDLKGDIIKVLPDDCSPPSQKAGFDTNQHTGKQIKPQKAPLPRQYSARRVLYFPGDRVQSPCLYQDSPVGVPPLLPLPLTPARTQPGQLPFSPLHWSSSVSLPESSLFWNSLLPHFCDMGCSLLSPPTPLLPLPSRVPHGARSPGFCSGLSSFFPAHGFHLLHRNTHSSSHPSFNCSTEFQISHFRGSLERLPR